MKGIHPKDHKQCEAHEKKDGELTGCCNYCTEMFRQLEDEIHNLSWDLTEHKTEFNCLQKFSDGVGKMFNPIKEQIEAMKLDIQKLKENENESVFESVTSDSPGRERRKKSPGDVPGVTMEALTELQAKIDDLGDELRMEFQGRFEEGDKKMKRN